MGLLWLALAGPTLPDPRGPIILGKPPLVSSAGVQSAEEPHAVSPRDAGPGIGKWIWLSGSAKAFASRFRKRIELSKEPSQTRVWISADIRYRLWINGRLASRGPADVGRDYDSGPCGPWFDDVRDVTKFFHKGKNIVAAEVFRNPIVGSEWPTEQPGLKMDLKFSFRGGPDKVCASDATWSTADAPDLNQEGATRGFRIDLNREPIGWRSDDFDDRMWPAAMVVDRRQARTLVSELAPPMEAIVKPVGFTRVHGGVTVTSTTAGAEFSSDGSYSIRYGHVLSGYVGLTVQGHRGERLRIMPNEHDAPGESRAAEILLRDGIQTVELPFMDSFSVVNIQAEGVREPLEIQDVRCVFTSYPVRYLGAFSCSNPEWNKLWNVCRWVTQICMQTHHMDSPNHQEPISDAGDYLIEAMNGYYCFGDGTLARQDLKKIGRTLAQRHYQSFHTSYSLLWLRMLLDYYDYTGDVGPVNELAPNAFALMDRFAGYIGPKGLVSEAPNYMFMDWEDVEGFNLHHPPAVIGQGYMTALYYQALGDAIRVCELNNDLGRAAGFRSIRAGLKSAFERELWVEGAGLYRDGKPFQTAIAPNSWLPADKEIETFTTQVNALAISCGLCTGPRAAQVMGKLLARPDMNCQPYFMKFVFDAKAAAGQFDGSAANQIDRWKIVPDTQSFLEMWNTGDLSHAWNATPLYQMSARVLGVQPTAPGFAKFKIDPHPLGLNWAKGVVPTPHGPIRVSWKRSDRGVLVDFTVPNGTMGVLNRTSFPPGNHHALLQP